MRFIEIIFWLAFWSITLIVVIPYFLVIISPLPLITAISSFYILYIYKPDPPITFN
jgi:hypothetical protein